MKTEFSIRNEEALSHTAYLLLGSNLGNRNELLQQALDSMGTLGNVTALSQRKETAPWGFAEDVPPFLNQVVCLQTALQPEPLLTACQTIENELGRDREAEVIQTGATSAGTSSARSAKLAPTTQFKAQGVSSSRDLGKRTYYSRSIDIDILLYDRLHYSSPTLTIPHPRLLERPFAVELLQEILPKDISLQDFYR